MFSFSTGKNWCSSFAFIHLSTSYLSSCLFNHLMKVLCTVIHLKVARLQGFVAEIYFFLLSSTSVSNENEWDPNPTPSLVFSEGKLCQIKVNQRTHLKLPVSRRIWLLRNLTEFPLNSFYVNKWLNDSQTLITILSSSLNTQPHQRLFICKQIKAAGLVFLRRHVYMWIEMPK